MKQSVPEMTSLVLAVFSYLKKKNLLVSTSGFIQVFYLAFVQGSNCHLVVPICWFSSHDHSSPGVSFILNSLARETGATKLLSLP